MKVKARIVRDVEIEINDPAVAELDDYWRSNEIPTSYSPELNAMVKKAVIAVEKATGIPFGDELASETISCVYAMDGESILES